MSASVVRRNDYLTELEFDTDTPGQNEAKRRSEVARETLPDNNDMPDDDWGAESEESDDESEESASAAPQACGLGDNQAIKPPANWKISMGSSRRKAGNWHTKQMKRTSVRRATLFTICMNNSNMRCNGMQTVTGMFAHSTNTPVKVIEMMSHAGLSIAPSTIDRMSERMSKEAQKRLKKCHRNMLYGITYDNLEITFNTAQPTLTHDTKLAHLMTATLIPLQPGTQKEDLCISEELWAQSVHNPDRSEDAPKIDLSHDHFLDLVAKSSFTPEDERSIESLYAWHVRKMLLDEDVDTIAPALKESFRINELGLPVSRGTTKPVKTVQVPLRAAEINVSTNHGNATAIENILNQTGVTDKDLEKLIYLTHGDLGSYEHLLSLMESWSIEATARKRLQFIVFIIGWFHTRMAMANSLWQLYIEPDKPRAGHHPSPRSIFRCCTILRPREEGKLSSNPGF
ncbi:hypothetical protein FRC07_006996 [Ceratobasidium sp. 392]|nr:hypothetical protein FRC07_006996 [Ceratobasidium sp. 392]